MLEIYVLGDIALKLNGQTVNSITSRKGLGVFVYLACHEHAISRQSLAELFYGHLPQKRAMANLRVLLSRLRPVASYLTLTRSTVAFDTTQPHFLDIRTLEAALQQATTPLTETSAESLAEALALYRGDFLAGFHLSDTLSFEEWVVVEQERLRQLAVDGLTRLTTYYFETQQTQPGLDSAARLLQIDNLHEEAYRLMMHLLVQANQRAQALSYYERCCQVLDTELGVPPAAETVALYEQILAHEGHSPTPVRQPHNLPRLVSGTVGRTHEVTQIIERLANPDCRLLTLVGLGGIGKTRLALLVARQLLGEPLFSDGIYFISLVAVQQPGLIIETITDALGITFDRDDPPEMQLAAYFQHKTLLLILDNFEHLLPAAEQVASLLQQAPGLKVMAVARDRLNIQGEWLFRVRGLAYPTDATSDPLAHEAVQLFLSTARRVLSDFVVSDAEVAHIVHICQLVEGMPLAIELAASWLRVLPCAEIVTELQRNLDFLSTSLRDIPERHRSLRALLNQTWAMLSDAEQDVFSRLSVFQGGFDRIAAEKVAGATLQTLAVLLDKAMLQRDAQAEYPRYHIHDLLQRYAFQKLAQPTEAAQRHSHYYAAWMQAQTAPLRGAGQQQALQAINTDLSNVRAAWHQAIAHRDWGVIEQMLAALFHFYDMRSWFREGYEAFRQASEHLQPGASQPEQRVIARLVARQGWFNFHLGHYQQAETELQQSLTTLQQGDAPHDVVFCLNYLAAIHRHTGNYEAAHTALAESLTISEASGDTFGTSIALNILGQVYSLQGDDDRAVQCCREALTLKQALGDLWGMTYSLTYLGRIAIAQAHVAEAAQFFADSLTIYQDIGDQRGVAFCLQNMGAMSRARGHVSQAVAQYQQALALFEHIGGRLGALHCLTALGEIYRAQDDHVTAQTYYERALPLSLALPVPDELVNNIRAALS